MSRDGYGIGLQRHLGIVDEALRQKSGRTYTESNKFVSLRYDDGFENMITAENYR